MTIPSDDLPFERGSTAFRIVFADYEDAVVFDLAAILHFYDKGWTKPKNGGGKFKALSTEEAQLSVSQLECEGNPLKKSTKDPIEEPIPGVEGSAEDPEDLHPEKKKRRLKAPSQGLPGAAADIMLNCKINESGWPQFLYDELPKEAHPVGPKGTKKSYTILVPADTPRHQQASISLRLDACAFWAPLNTQGEKVEGCRNFCFSKLGGAAKAYEEVLKKVLKKEEAS